MENSALDPGQTNNVPKKRLLLFLIESEIRPLVFIGKCVQQFGIGAFLGFLLGASAIYGYALFKPLPFVTAVSETKETKDKTITLKGRVVDLSNRAPLKEAFHVGILQSEAGPFENRDGEFSIRVASRGNYDFIVWNRDYQIVRVYRGWTAREHSGDVSDLEDKIPFPTKLGIMQANFKNQDGEPIRGYLQVGDISKKIEANGDCILEGIPLGRIDFRIMPAQAKSPPIYSEKVNLQLNGITPVERTIPTGGSMR